MKDIVIANSGNGDWVGIYVDEILVKENHSLYPSEILSALGISHRRVTISGERLEEIGRLPKTLQELDEIIDDEMNCNMFDE